MNRKSRTAACRSPEQTRPRLLKEYRAPAAAACSHAAAGSTHHARMRSDQEPPPPGGPRFGQPGRPTREWRGRLAQTREQDRQDCVQHGRGRPSVGETPANTVDVFLASAAPPARDSGCPPNRVNPNPRPSWDASADHDWQARSGWVASNTDASKIKDAPLADVVKLAEEHTKHPFFEFTEYRPFDGLVKERPLRALSALSLEARTSRYPVPFWRSALTDWP